MNKNLMIAGCLAGTVMVSACATDDPHRRAKIGAAIGAVTGAVIGHQADGDKGRYIGALLGGIAGAAAGDYMDNQQAELERRLKEEQEAKELKITRLPDGSLLVGIASEASFAVNQSTVKSEFVSTFQKIAKVLQDYESTAVHIVGHTDSSGSTAYNQTLSEGRAASVGRLFEAQGLDARRIQPSGRGELEPIASNASESGRSQNRRVDIVIKPIIQGEEDEAFRSPGFLGS